MPTMQWAEFCSRVSAGNGYMQGLHAAGPRNMAMVCSMQGLRVVERCCQQHTCCTHVLLQKLDVKTLIMPTKAAHVPCQSITDAAYTSIMNNWQAPIC